MTVGTCFEGEKFMRQFTLEERDRRWKKGREEMGKRDLGAPVVWSSFGHHGTQKNAIDLSSVNTQFINIT